MAVGMSVAQQMLKPSGASGGSADAAAPFEVLSPAQVAGLLGVPEADVVASLESGDLKGKRIGSQWRVTKAAVDRFLRG